MTRAVILCALLCACTARPLVVPGPGDGSRDFSVVNGDLGVDLAGADLTGADLAGADLAGVDLAGSGGGDMAMVPLPRNHGAAVGTGIALLAKDLDGDGDQDLVVVEAAGTVRIYNGNGMGALFPRQAFEINTNTNLATGILADVDADGVLDLVLAEDGVKSEVDVLRGNGDATFADWARILIPGGVSAVAVGDLNADGAPDVVATTWDGLLHVMQGTSGEKPSLLLPTYAVDQGSMQIDLVDLKGDGTLYAVSVAPASSELVFWQGNGDLTFGNRSFAAEPARSVRFVLGDWDGDGLLDTATVGNEPMTIAPVIVQVDLSTGVGSPVILDTGFSSVSGVDGLAAGDMTGDGIADLVISSDGSSIIAIAVANGAGLFPKMTGIVTDEGATCIALADFDNDGHLDIAAAGPTKTQLYLTQP